jgi:hypothetical protein
MGKIDTKITKERHNKRFAGNRLINREIGKL